MKKGMNIIITLFAVFISVILIASTVIFLLGKIESIPKEKIKKGCKIEQRIYQERSVYLVTPPTYQENSKVVLYVHGGSYMGNLTTWYWNFITQVAKDTGYLLIVPDYPLTPNYNYEDVFAFMNPLYTEIVKQVPKDKLILLGDSAGGGLSLALIELLGEEEKQIPSKTILISPWLDVRMQNPKSQEIQTLDPELSIVNLKIAGIAYAGKEGMNSYLVNPIDGPLDKLENLVIYTGTNDVLNPDVWILEERAKQQGVTINIKETEGAIHNWIIELSEEVESSMEDYQDLIDELKG